MSFRVKEIFRTLQGEGIRAGRQAVFCRFSGCNLWSGRDEDRKAAACSLCDTDISGTDGPCGGIYKNEDDLVRAIFAAFEGWEPEELYENPAYNVMTVANKGMVWNGMGMVVAPALQYVVFTGGEPARQLTQELIDNLRGYRIELAVETNGTLALPGGLDWVTVSPKAGTKLVVRAGQELKLVWPQTIDGKCVDPDEYACMQFEYFVLQPLDTGDARSSAENARAVYSYCLEHPKWRMGVQMHKVFGFK